MSETHDHAHHGHSHDVVTLSAGHVQKLWRVLALTTVYMVVEFVGGWLSGSLALTADAVHMLGDTTALGLSLLAAWFCILPARPQNTFGYQRAEVLAALFNSALLAVLALAICHEGYERFAHPAGVNAQLMWKIALGGLVVNLIAVKVLHSDSHTNMNVKGAYLHVLGDLLGSVGALIAAGLMIFGGWAWADPLISVVIALLVLRSAWMLLKDSMNILLEGCPSHIDVRDIEKTMLSFEGVEAVHNLHVWNIDSQSIVLTAHLVVQPSAYSGETMNKVQTALKEDFGLSHVTLQLEQAGPEDIFFCKR